MLYVDGVEVATLEDAAITALDIDAAEGATVIGNRIDTIGGTFHANQGFTGELDEIKIYSRILSEGRDHGDV